TTGVWGSHLKVGAQVLHCTGVCAQLWCDLGILQLLEPHSRQGMSVAESRPVARLVFVWAVLLATCAPVAPPPQPEGTAARAGHALGVAVVLPPVIDTLPYFTNNPAKTAFDEGNPARTLDLLKSEATTLPIRYLRAEAAWKAGRLDAASEELELLALHYAPMRDRILNDLGQVEEQRKLPLRAEAAYARVSSASFVFADARFALARLLKARGQFAAA